MNGAKNHEELKNDLVSLEHEVSDQQRSFSLRGKETNVISPSYRLRRVANSIRHYYYFLEFSLGEGGGGWNFAIKIICFRELMTSF